MSLVPERRRCPPKWWVPFQGGTIGVPAESIFGGAHEGETRRKGVTTFFIMSKARRGGHVRFSTLPFSERAFPCLTLKYRGLINVNLNNGVPA